MFFWATKLRIKNEAEISIGFKSVFSCCPVFTVFCRAEFRSFISDLEFHFAFFEFFTVSKPDSPEASGLSGLVLKDV